MGGVGLGGEGVAATHGVEVPYEGRVGLPGFGRGDVFDAVSAPQAAGASEGGETAFGGDAGSGEDEEAVGWGEVHEIRGFEGLWRDDVEFFDVIG